MKVKTLLDEELTNILFEEVLEQTLSYLTFIQLTNDETTSSLNQKKYVLIDDKNRLEVIYVHRISRTSILFSFSFTKVNKLFLMKIVNIIDSYIDYNLRVDGNAYYDIYKLNFRVEIGSKEKCELFFKNMFTNS